MACFRVSGGAHVCGFQGRKIVAREFAAGQFVIRPQGSRVASPQETNDSDEIFFIPRKGLECPNNASHHSCRSDPVSLFRKETVEYARLSVQGFFHGIEKDGRGGFGKERHDVVEARPQDPVVIL